MITRIGRYDVEAELGRGAMAVVYKANDPVIGRVVAIKTIRLEHSLGLEQQELRQRLYREAQSAGKLNHPAIITIYDMGEEGELSYIAMEYVEGETLEQWLARTPIPPLEQTIAIVEQIAAGLDFAAARGIIHRDIKPGNILLTHDLRAKIADFGIAKISLAKFTQTGLVMGTPSYMSPEQAMGKELDGRSDIFSLGVMFYQMLTGERPFSGNNPTTIIYKILHEEPIPPRQLNVTLHPGYDFIVRRMLAKDPAQRYQTCGEFTRDLKNYEQLEHEAGRTAATARIVAPVVKRESRFGTKSIVLISALFVVILGALAVLLMQSGGPVPATPGGPPNGNAQQTVPPAAPEFRAVPPPAAESGPARESAPAAPEPAAKTEPPPVSNQPALVRIVYEGPEYPVLLYNAARRLHSAAGAARVSVPAGDHRFRIVSPDVYLDRPFERVRLKPEQVYTVTVPGTASAYIEVPNDAYDGCEILLNGTRLPVPYPAQVQKMAAGPSELKFRWTAGKYQGKEFAAAIQTEASHHYLIKGDPQTDTAVLQMVR